MHTLVTLAPWPSYWPCTRWEVWAVRWGCLPCPAPPHWTWLDYHSQSPSHHRGWLARSVAGLQSRSSARQGHLYPEPPGGGGGGGGLTLFVREEARCRGRRAGDILFNNSYIIISWFPQKCHQLYSFKRCPNTRVKTGNVSCQTLPFKNSTRVITDCLDSRDRRFARVISLYLSHRSWSKTHLLRCHVERVWLHNYD